MVLFVTTGMERASRLYCLFHTLRVTQAGFFAGVEPGGAGRVRTGVFLPSSASAAELSLAEVSVQGGSSGTLSATT